MKCLENSGREIVDAKLVVWRNTAQGQSVQVNAPIGTGRLTIYKEAAIEDNIATNRAAQINYPITEKVLKMVQKEGTGWCGRWPF
ncbi:hypothetical protein B0T14DRAFT_570539 [Immersiella caudata]|uniref:Uncharacterized protein n=1 Tax=Immersiella caudata TaxID=314043 RepID=A0AA39WFT9_9PEZI|nr:hypothetical protein B0T14DRAFT_570539 [Immersiella caudata]